MHVLTFSVEFFSVLKIIFVCYFFAGIEFHVSVSCMWAGSKAHFCYVMAMGGSSMFKYQSMVI